MIFCSKNPNDLLHYERECLTKECCENLYITCPEITSMRMKKGSVLDPELIEALSVYSTWRDRVTWAYRSCLAVASITTFVLLYVYMNTDVYDDVSYLTPANFTFSVWLAIFASMWFWFFTSQPGIITSFGYIVPTLVFHGAALSWTLTSYDGELDPAGLFALGACIISSRMIMNLNTHLPVVFSFRRKFKSTIKQFLARFWIGASFGWATIAFTLHSSLLVRSYSNAVKGEDDGEIISCVILTLFALVVFLEAMSPLLLLEKDCSEQIFMEVLRYHWNPEISLTFIWYFIGLISRNESNLVTATSIALTVLLCVGVYVSYAFYSRVLSKHKIDTRGLIFLPYKQAAVSL